MVRQKRMPCLQKRLNIFKGPYAGKISSFFYFFSIGNLENHSKYHKNRKKSQISQKNLE